MVRCFTATGFTKTSMADIIAESGLSAGAIYSHFSGKQEILLATAASALETAQSMIEAAAAEGVHGIAPRPLARMLIDEVMPRDMLRVVLQFWAESPSDPDLAVLVGRNLGHIRGVIVGVLQPWAQDMRGDARPAGRVSDDDAAVLASRAADQIMVVVHGYLVRTSLDPHADPVSLKETALELLQAE